MSTPPTSRCPGCGASLPETDALAAARFNASPACWQCCGELTVYTLARDRSHFIHQHVVDAYAAQHVGVQMRPITVAFALIGLYFACERGATGLQVQRIHTLLARRSKIWPQFAPPACAGDVTVAHVLAAAPGTVRDDAIHYWARSVWEAWRAQHEQVRALAERLLAD